jgi:hypothetical protein
MESTAQPEPGGQPATQPGAQSAAPIDLRKLAEKVYRLMLEDLRREQARGARLPRQGGER